MVENKDDKVKQLEYKLGNLEYSLNYMQQRIQRAKSFVIKALEEKELSTTQRELLIKALQYLN